MLINVSNHPSEKWPTEQMEAAKKEYGEPIIDIPFPEVPPEADEKEVEIIANKLYEDIFDTYNRQKQTNRFATCAVMLMGEYSVFFRVTKRILNGILPVFVVVATTKRIVEENKNVKKSVFQFVRFRKIK